jgi:hypothetical protein
MPCVEVSAVLFIAFLVPVSLYLLFLGWVNRQPRAFVLSGVWDAIALLFACSGFIVFGGPAILSAEHERWRSFWLFGKESTAEMLDFARNLWMVAGLAYFLVIFFGCVIILSRRRRLTCIYNVEPQVVETVLVDTCHRLGFDPIRTGNLFVFGLPLTEGQKRPALQKPHSLRLVNPAEFEVEEPSPADQLAGLNAILELEPSENTKCVLLHWDSHDSPVRTMLEAEIIAQLRSYEAPEHDTWFWQGLIACIFLGISAFISLALSIRSTLLL